MRGREICRHVPSQKCELGVNTGAEGELVNSIRKASLCPSEKGELGVNTEVEGELATNFPSTSSVVRLNLLRIFGLFKACSNMLPE